jgi:hypothetical protein
VKSYSYHRIKTVWHYICGKQVRKRRKTWWLSTPETKFLREMGYEHIYDGKAIRISIIYNIMALQMTFK